LKLNRRNYYRVLHVQPEAPAEIVTASYRTLMSKLRQHPDLGGDPDAALIINEAYAQLKDPEKRRAYDLRLRALRTPARSYERGSAQPGALGACAFCGTALPGTLGPEERCSCCGSPLAPIAAVSRERPELFGRRRAPRTAKSDEITVYPAWKSPARSGRLHDLSMTGASILVDTPLQAGQVIRIASPSFDMLAVVLACRRIPRLYVVHTRLLSVIFTRSRGVFVSTQA
jgi:curved DNA-binding protein CbpA